MLSQYRNSETNRVFFNKRPFVHNSIVVIIDKHLLMIAPQSCDLIASMYKVNDEVNDFFGLSSSVDIVS